MVIVRSVEKKFSDMIKMNKREKAFEKSSGNDFLFIFILTGGIAYLTMNLFFSFSFGNILHVRSFDMFFDEIVKLMTYCFFQLNIIIRYSMEKWKMED